MTPARSIGSTAAWPTIGPIELATFTFPDPEMAGREGVVIAYVVRHRGGILLFDTGFGFGDAELDASYHPIARRIDDALRDDGIDPDNITAVANCHLHADHAGQNRAFGSVPIFVQAVEWELAHTTDHTILDWVDFPGARYRHLVGDARLADGIRTVATPGHTKGHQSLVVDGRDGPIILAGQACYSFGEWVGETGAIEGGPSAADPVAYAASIERLRSLDPAAVHFAHDRRSWTR
jgi:N-acyl homoserine lactone hydrolase